MFANLPIHICRNEPCPCSADEITRDIRSSQTYIVRCVLSPVLFTVGVSRCAIAILLSLSLSLSPSILLFSSPSGCFSSILMGWLGWLSMGQVVIVKCDEKLIAEYDRVPVGNTTIDIPYVYETRAFFYTKSLNSYACTPRLEYTQCCFFSGEATRPTHDTEQHTLCFYILPLVLSFYTTLGETE